jgi:hypothetical protein
MRLRMTLVGLTVLSRSRLASHVYSFTQGEDEDPPVALVCECGDLVAVNRPAPRRAERDCRCRANQAGAIAVRTHEVRGIKCQRCGLTLFFDGPPGFSISQPESCDGRGGHDPEPIYQTNWGAR